MAETTEQETSEATSEATAQETQSSQREGTEVPPEVKAALKKANKEAETLRLKLKEYEDASKSEQDKLAERAAGAETKAAALEAKLNRIEVGAAKGLPAELAVRLQGDSQEEMEADAERLLGYVKPAAPGFDGGARESATNTNDMDSAIRRAAGRA